MSVNFPQPHSGQTQVACQLMLDSWVFVEELALSLLYLRHTAVSQKQPAFSQWYTQRQYLLSLSLVHCTSLGARIGS